ncbi:MAG TPA: LysM peptidoglycan-binding domain-containing protein [Gemmatimonadales bacterium]|nr:LysM peptidoglycan-binding domain-containing protein [Gemmatimonadales bacterium]
MRRTTICRFDRQCLVVAAALGLGPVAVLAQDTARVAPDTAPAAVATGQLPASHTVVRGETLWSISQLYFGDPLLWPEIYRLNTAVIEDPHWIYPGEVLVLAPAVVVAQGPADTLVGVPTPAADTVRAEPGADTVAAALDTLPADTALVVVEPPPPEPTGAYETIFDRRRSRTEEVQRILRAYAEQPYRPVRRGEFYAAGFLTEEERLPYGTVLGNTERPAIRRLTPQSSATTFDEIAIRPPRGASYHVGDSVLIVRLDRTLAGWGEVVVPHGVARVTEVQEQQVLAELVMQFARVRNGHLALPLEPFRDPGEVRPTPVEQGLEGRLVGPRDLHALANQQQFVFIDRGRADGVVPGDVFEVYRPAAGEPGTASEQVLASLLIVHTRERSATGMIVGINHPTLVPGLPVRLVKKMPS